MVCQHSYGMSTFIYSSAIFIYSYYIYLLTKKDITNINIIGMLTWSCCIDMKCIEWYREDRYVWYADISDGMSKYLWYVDIYLFLCYNCVLLLYWFVVKKCNDHSLQEVMVQMAI